MSFVRQRMDAARIDPTVIEIEQRANRDGEVKSFVIPSRCPRGFEIGRLNARRIVVHCVYKTEENFMLLIQRGGFQIAQNAPDQLFTA